MIRVVRLGDVEKRTLLSLRGDVLSAPTPPQARKALRQLRAAQRKIAVARGLDPFAVHFAYGAGVHVSYPMTADEENRLRGDHQ